MVPGRHPRSGSTMRVMTRDVQFVRAVDAAYTDLRDRLAARGPEIVGASGEPPRMDLVVRVGATEIRREVLVAVGALDEPDGSGCHLRFTADASAHPDLFPHLEGRIDLVPISALRTAVFFVAAYTPPLGVVGSAIDLLGLHRFAEDAMERLFDRIVERSLA